MNDLSKQLKKKYADVERLGKIKKYLPEMRRRIVAKKRALKRFRLRADKEYEDVDKLINLGLSRLFERLLGDFEERLEKEKQEYLLAVVAIQAVEAELKGLEFQAGVLQKEVMKLKNANSELKVLLKRAEIKSQVKDSKKSMLIKRFNQDILIHNAIISEIAEAQTAGEEAKKSLDKLKWSISKFLSWGEVMSVNLRYHGKGTQSSYAKKRDADRSKGLMFKCMYALNSFERELADVSKDLRLDYTDHLEVIHDFIDIFLDSLITDWIVRRKIHSALTAIELVYDKILRLQQMLAHDQEKQEATISVLEQEKVDLLLK